MEFFKKETRIDFMGVRRYTGALTALLWIVSLWLLMTKGINFGLDFTGGTQVEARFASPVEPATIRAQLEAQGFHGVRVQQYGSTQDILIRIANPKEAIERSEKVALSEKSELTEKTANVAQESDPLRNTENATKPPANAANENVNNTENSLIKSVKAELLKSNPGVEIRRTEFVGSEVGEQLVEQGGVAVLLSILATMVYIALRFEYRLAISAAVGLCHDGVIILGIFSLFGFEFDLATLASVMAVLGYSLNDTIVVFDRVRENFRRVRKGSPEEIMNLSINQTLSRTIMTSWMTMLVVLALLIFGGESLFGFSMAFFVGILIGTFSSIYVSGALALWLGLSKADLMPKQRVLDERP